MIDGQGKETVLVLRRGHARESNARAGATDGTLKNAVDRVIEMLSQRRRAQSPNLVLDEPPQPSQGR